MSTSKISAGLLMYRFPLQVFLVHPGGPFFKNRGDVWSIPKGLCEKNEEPLVCAIREFTEETGIIPHGPYCDLGTVGYSNKTVHAWAFGGDLPKNFVLKSNLTAQGWPECDKGEFFNLEASRLKILPAQKIFLVRLFDLL